MQPTWQVVLNISPKVLLQPTVILNLVQDLTARLDVYRRPLSADRCELNSA